MEFRRTLSKIILLASLVLAGCGKSDPPASPPSPPPFGSFRWPAFPVEIHVEPSLMKGAKKRDLKAAVSFWERHAGKTLFHLAGDWLGPALPYTGPPDHPDSISENAILFEGEWTFEKNIAGKTSLRIDGGNISGAVILLDPETALCTETCADDDESTSLRRLLAHELGHFLGLGHAPDPENIMYPSIQPGGTLKNRLVDEDALRRLTQ